MPKTCYVKNCKSAHDPSSQLKFHRFPKDPGRRKHWLSIIPTKGKSIELARICSLHFKEFDYDSYGYLRTNAEPFYNSESGEAEPEEYLGIYHTFAQKPIIKPAAEMMTDILKGMDQPKEDLGICHTLPQKPILKSGADRTIIVDGGDQVKCETQLENSMLGKWLQQRPEISLKRCTLESNVYPVKVASESQPESPMSQEILAQGRPKMTLRTRPTTPVKTSISDIKYPVKVCRICLASKTKLFDMDKHNLKTLYETLTNSSVAEDGLLHMLCFVCTARLRAYHSFRSKALRSQGLLADLAPFNRWNVSKKIKSIDRATNNLTSLLDCHSFVDHSNLHILENETFDEKTHELETLDKKEEIATQTEEKKTDTIKIKDIEYLENELESNTETLVETEPKIIKTPDIESDESTTFDVEYLEDDLETEAKEIQVNNEPENSKKLSESYNVEVEFEVEYLDNDLETDNTAKKVKVKKESKVSRKRSKIKTDVESVNKNIAKKSRPKGEVPISEEVFDITTLTLEEQIEEVRKRKESANYKKSPFKCKDCFKGFKNAEVYRLHVIQHTDQSGPFVCKVCKMHYRSRHRLREHAKLHGRRYTCKLCSYVTFARNGAKLHVDFHQGTKYVCPHCQEHFDKYTTYLGHLRIKHPTDFVCALCGYSFVSETGLSIHKKLKHRFQQLVPENGPLCEQCNIRFATKEALQQHIKLSPSHNDAEKMREIGTRKVEKRSAVSQRPAKPTGPITCEQCNAQLPDVRAYSYHFRREHPDKNRTLPCLQAMCEVCGKLFQNMTTLHYHSFIHKEAKLFKCQQCGKSFRQSTGLVVHMRVHQPTRPAHPCEECGKLFVTRNNRERHMFIHLGLKPYKCEICGKCFVHESQKRDHVSYVHLKKPWPKRNRRQRRTDTKKVKKLLQRSEDEDAEKNNPKIDNNGRGYVINNEK